jgi:hypothetical protein
MKTTVMGVFPRLEDGQRVLGQLVASTLALDAIRVLHKDPVTQRALASEAGLPVDRSVVAGLGAGAVLGCAVGFFVGLTPGLPLAQAGPLFLGALGLLLGAAAGAAVSAMTDALPVPRAQLPELAEIVDRGATVVLVRTDSLPTARAIRDLFQANGSEVLIPVEDEDVIEEISTPPEAAADPLPSLAPAEGMGPPAQAVPEAHAPFVPPWRRLWRGGKAADGAESNALEATAAATMAGPAVATWERPAPPDAEPLMYQPPEAADVAADAVPNRSRPKPQEAPPEPDES